MNKKLLLGVFFIFVMVSWWSFASGDDTYPGEGHHAIVYKSPDCGCCLGHVAALKREGFDVEAIATTDMGSVKDKYNIPRSMESCHTTIIGDYFVEGHVPLEAIMKLLGDGPDISGISLPNMPAGSTGMPGVKSGPFRIYSLNNGKVSDFMMV